jgi:Ca-activated chloride channel homolog
MPDHREEQSRRSVRPVVSVLATVFGGFGIALQQLATGEPASLSRWLMLVIGSFIGGAVGILATGLFERMIGWVVAAWGILRWKYFAVVAAVCAVALGLGFAIPPVYDLGRRWLSGCAEPAEVRVLTSTEQLDAIRQLADEYEQWTAGRHHGCPASNLYVYAASPAATHDAIASGWLEDPLAIIGPRPDVWLPDSTLDITDTLTRASRYGVTLPIAENRPIAYSPLVLGVPAASSFGDVRREWVWSRLWQETVRRGWDVVRPDPAVSETGVLATTALYESLKPTGQPLADPATTRAVEQRLERSLDQGQYPLGSSEDLLCRGGSAAVVASEQAIVRYNQGLACPLSAAPAPEQALSIFYPPDTLSLNHPFVRLNWDGTGSQSASVAFGAWLDSADGKRALLHVALRPPPLFEVTEPLTERYGAHAGVAFDRRTPVKASVDAATARYDQARRPGRVLIALDASGSMQTPVDRSGTTRFQLASKGVEQVFGLMSDRDQFGLRVFPGRELVPLGGSRAAAGPALAGVRPGGGTPLYSTIAAGVDEVASGNTSDAVLSLVVLTDGNDTSAVRPSDVDVHVRGKGVRVFVVAIGAASCGALALRDITGHTGGGCYDAGLDSLDDVLADLFGRLWGGDTGNG